MKKITIFLLAFILLLGLNSCSYDTEGTAYVQPPQNTLTTEETISEITETDNIDTSISTENTDGYIGNMNSKIFHSPLCHTLPIEKNRVYFNTRSDAIQNGYNPCGNCNP